MCNTELTEHSGALCVILGAPWLAQLHVPPQLRLLVLLLLLCWFLFQPMNVSDPETFVKTTAAPSRGALTTDFLSGSQSPLDYLQVGSCQCRVAPLLCMARHGTIRCLLTTIA